MARYGRRSSRRRTSRRGARALSARRIFGNKSARAQASQISALKKRLNYVYRQCRPETKLKEGEIVALSSDRTDPQPYHIYTIDMPTPGTGDSNMVGNVCNIKDVHVQLNCEIDESFLVAQFSLTAALPITCEYRVILFALKNATDTAPSADDIGVFTNYGESPQAYFMNAVRPLNEGVSSIVDILYDRRFTISNMNYRSRSHNLRVKGSRIMKYVTSEYMNLGKSQLYLLIVPVLQYTPSIDAVETQPPPANPVFNSRVMSKIAYTDP